MQNATAGSPKALFESSGSMLRADLPSWADPPHDGHLRMREMRDASFFVLRCR